MRGQISSINPQSNQGMVLGEDGQQYPFILQNNPNSMTTKVGEFVEFAVDNQGFANSIQIAINPYQPRMPPPLPPITEFSPLSTQINPVWAEEENYGMFDWVKKCFRNYATFKGRARRKEYWYFQLFWTLVVIITIFLEEMLKTNGMILGLIFLVFFMPLFSSQVRRLHDVNKSGWWILIGIIPLVGSIILFVWHISDTLPMVNKWGLPARRP